MLRTEFEQKVGAQDEMIKLFLEIKLHDAY